MVTINHRNALWAIAVWNFLNHGDELIFEALNFMYFDMIYSVKRKGIYRNKRNIFIRMFWRANKGNQTELKG